MPATAKLTREGWQQREAQSTAQREENCRVALARILGGDAHDPEEPFPRIGVCLGGAANWDTPLSCIAFLDGLSAPLHASSTQTGTNGAKLIDTVITVSSSGTASWACGASLGCTAFGVASVPGPEGSVSTPFHGTLRISGPSNPWDAYTDQSSGAGEVKPDERPPTPAAASNGKPARSRDPDARLAPQPRNPWQFGTSNYFHDGEHTYNGLVAIFSRRPHCEASQLVRVQPVHRLTTSAIVGGGLIVPGALLNPVLGASMMERWTTFLRHVWLPPRVEPRRVSNHEPDDTRSSRASRTSTAVYESVPLFSPILSSMVESGELPFMVFAALDTQSDHTRCSRAGHEGEAQSWCGPALRWMEFTPLFVRAAALLCSHTEVDSAVCASPLMAPKEVLHSDDCHLHADFAEADLTNRLKHIGEEDEGDHTASSQHPAGRALTSPDEPLCLHHVMSLCASGLPLTLVEQQYAYLTQRDNGNGNALPPFLFTGEDDWDERLWSPGADTAAPGGAAGEPLSEATSLLEDDLTSPPPSPRLLSSAVERSTEQLPWAAVPLYAQRHGGAAVNTALSAEPPSPCTQSSRSDRVHMSASVSQTSGDSGPSACGEGVSLPREAPRELFAMCRDSTASFRAPLPSLLAASSGRHFDIIVVHDTAPSSSYPRVPEPLARAVELGFYKLDERVAAEESLCSPLQPSASLPNASCVSSSSLTRPFERHEVVRVFRGAPGYPTILYFFGLPGRRCLESVLDGDALRRACHEIRGLVMDHVTPTLIHEARRWRYLRKTNFPQLSPSEERALRSVPTRFAPVAFPALNRAHTVMDEVWYEVRREDTVHQSSSAPLRCEQQIVDYTAVEVICLIDLELKGVRGQISSLEAFRQISSMFFDQLPPDRHRIMARKLQSSALHYLSVGGETNAWKPLSYFFPTMDHHERCVLRKALHFNVFQWRRVQKPTRGRLRDFRARLRGAQGGQVPPLGGDAGDTAEDEEVQVSLRPFSAVYFAFGTLLTVFRPHEELLCDPAESQLASVDDFHRIEWLRSNLSVLLIHLLCLGSLLLGIWEELVEVLGDAFARQIVSYYETVHTREEALRRRQRARQQGSSATGVRGDAVTVDGVAARAVVELSEDEIAEASQPVPTARTAEAPVLSRRGSREHGRAGLPPSVTSYASSTAVQPLGTLDIRALCTALALALEVMFLVDPESGANKAAQLLDTIDGHIQSRCGLATSTLPARCVIAAPALLTGTCEATYGQLFTTTLMMAIAQSCYSVAFFQKMYDMCRLKHFAVWHAATETVMTFFGLHTLEALCDNENVSVRVECQRYLLKRAQADLHAFTADVAASQPPPSTWHADMTCGLWPDTEHYQKQSLGFKILRTAYAYALPNILSLLIPLAPNDVRGFMSVLSVMPSIINNPQAQRFRLHHCIHLFLARGWTDWQFFSFMVRTLIAKGIRMKCLAPAVYEMVIPCFVHRPLACESALCYATACRRLQFLSVECTAAPIAAGGSAAGCTHKRYSNAARAVTGTLAITRLHTTPQSVLKQTPSSAPKASVDRLAASNAVSRLRTATAASRHYWSESPPSNTTLGLATPMPTVEDGVGASSGLSDTERAAANELRDTLPVPLQVLLNTAIQCADANRQNVRLRPTDKVDRDVSAMVANQQF